MLGLGRALGETMAVTFVIGNTNRITPNLFGSGNTIASLVALEFGESQAGSLKLSSLLALGFILFVISLHRAGDLAPAAAARSAGMSASVAGTAPPHARDSRARDHPGGRRRGADRVVKVLCGLATLIGLGFLASILWTLLSLGAAGLHLSVFTRPTLPPGSGGGLLNAIVGSLIQTAIGTLLGTPIGIMVGTYLSANTRTAPGSGRRCASSRTCCCRRRRS